MSETAAATTPAPGAEGERRGRRGGRGFGRGGDRRGRRGGDRRGGRKEETGEGEWIPTTKLGRLVKEKLIKRLEEIYLFALPIKVRKILN